MERDLPKGELSWTGGAGNEEYVFDELCALSFVCWLWPTAMAEELSEQPAYPNYVGASLVVAAGRWAFASEALGGLLKTHRRWARCPLSTTSRTPRAIRRMSSPRGGGPRPIATCPRRPCPGKGNPRSTCPRRRCKWQPCCQGREFQSERGYEPPGLLSIPLNPTKNLFPPFPLFPRCMQDVDPLSSNS